MKTFLKGVRRSAGRNLEVEIEYLSGLSKITTTLSSDQILNMNAAAPVIIPPVPGKSILPMAFRFRSPPSLVPYVVTQDPLLFISNAYWQEIPLSATIADLLRSYNTVFMMTPWIPANPTPGFNSSVAQLLSNMENQPLLMGTQTSPTEGDGTLDVIVAYELV